MPNTVPVPDPLPPLWRRIDGLELIRLAVLVLITGVVGVMWHYIGVVIDNQEQIEQGQFKGKAIVCDQSAAQGLPLNPGCADPNVLRYRTITGNE